jgi:hypothetical protein
MKTNLVSASAIFLIFMISACKVLPGAPQEMLPDGSVPPGGRITILAGRDKTLLFRPEGVTFLSGRARIMFVERPYTDPDGRKIRELVIDVERSPDIPWVRDEKPFRMRIYAETDFTLEAHKRLE